MSIKSGQVAHERELNTLHNHGGTEIGNFGQFLKSIIDSANLWMNALDQEGNVTMWNKAAEKISGYSHEEVVGHGRIWEWLYPDEQYRSEVLRTAESILASGLREENFETKIRRKDGETRIVLWNFRVIFDKNNCSIASVALGLDITEQVRIRNEFGRYSKHMEDLVAERTKGLREGEERLRAILDSSPYPITISDLEGFIVDCNQALLKLHHYSSKDEIIGRSATMLFAGKERDTVRERFRKALETGSSRALEYALLTKDGREFPAEFSAAIVRDSEGNPIALVGISRDLTEHYQYEDRLRNAERMAAIGETAAMVGHDLRNPLQGISGAVYVLKQMLGSTAEAQATEMLGLIERAVEYADKIVKELLDYSREIRLELTETNAKEVVHAAIQQVKIPANVKIRNLAQQTPSLLVDAGKTERVFVNLIGNAVDAMPAGGVLSITSTESNEILEIRFADTGEGIPDNVMRDLWKPLKTTKSKGVGLGLAICKRIVEAHGGQVEVESTPGKGTTFTIRLPLTHNECSASPIG
jgi:PAS domain S-box-containing protein